MGPFHTIRRGTTALLALALAFGLAACDDVAPPFTVDGTGTVEGFLFFDADEDRVFDPSDGDEGIANVGVAALVRSTDDVLASATTGTDGRFVIEGVQPGTFDVLFDDTNLPDGVFVCQNPVQTTVFIDETTFLEVAARPACLIDIEEAQQAPLGEFVLVRARVTSFPGQIDFGDFVVQDETGGIWAFAPGLAGEGIQNGDLVEIGGVVSLFNDHLELEDVELRSVTPGVGVPAAEAVTTGAIAAAGDPRDPLQNLLVVVPGAELTRGFTSGGNRNALIDDGSGSTEIRVEDGLSADAGDAILTNLGLTVGNCYDITGIVGAFRGTAQLFPRSADDFVEVPCS